VKEGRRKAESGREGGREGEREREGEKERENIPIRSGLHFITPFNFISLEFPSPNTATLAVMASAYEVPRDIQSIVWETACWKGPH
jgi:hypothetical protein